MPLTVYGARKSAGGKKETSWLNSRLPTCSHLLCQLQAPGTHRVWQRRQIPRWPQNTSLESHLRTQTLCSPIETHGNCTAQLEVSTATCSFKMAWTYFFQSETCGPATLLQHSCWWEMQNVPPAYQPVTFPSWWIEWIPYRLNFEKRWVGIQRSC